MVDPGTHVEDGEGHASGAPAARHEDVLLGEPAGHLGAAGGQQAPRVGLGRIGRRRVPPQLLALLDVAHVDGLRPETVRRSVSVPSAAPSPAASQPPLARHEPLAQRFGGNFVPLDSRAI